jgi:aryl-alcohol dehydrogenase-like predicted oxidoreductase
MPSPNFRTLGRSGLVVSQFALGTMTFGANRWGSDATASRGVFDAYVAAGGNFLDAADVYSGGRSEEMIGDFIKDTGLRDRLVLATKAGFPRESGHPMAGGNGAKNIHAGLDGSLRRLKTDCVDLFWLHVWDMVTPAAEVLQTMAGLITAGKIRYYGLSNVPAWYAAQMATLAVAHGVPGPIALQMQYSLTDREAEREHIGAAQEFGMGMLGWSPLGGGLLTGKYARDAVEAKAPSGWELPSKGAAGMGDSDGRLNGANPFGDTKFSDQNWAILDVVRAVAEELGCTPAQVALAWALAQPGVTGLILGASRAEQLQANMAAQQVDVTPEQMARLTSMSAPRGTFFSPWLKDLVFGGQAVAAWRRSV